jgi:hypothetical protein
MIEFKVKTKTFETITVFIDSTETIKKTYISGLNLLNFPDNLAWFRTYIDTLEEVFGEINYIGPEFVPFLTRHIGKHHGTVTVSDDMNFITFTFDEEDFLAFKLKWI